MSKPDKHIENLKLECHVIQQHGHCKNNPAAWVAIKDIEISINELKKAFEEKINNDRKKR